MSTTGNENQSAPLPADDEEEAARETEQTSERVGTALPGTATHPTIKNS